VAPVARTANQAAGPTIVDGLTIPGSGFIAASFNQSPRAVFLLKRSRANTSNLEHPFRPLVAGSGIRVGTTPKLGKACGD
jgi:hypothetical protein